MEDKEFLEIENILLEKFEKNVNLKKQKTKFSAEFKYETDAKWFYLNICHPEDLKKDEYPVEFISSITPIGDLDNSTRKYYTIKFKVKDKEKLIDLLK